MRIGLISHCMDRSGAPIALMNLACWLKGQNHDVRFLGYGSGSLEQELTRREIPTVLLAEDVSHAELESLTLDLDMLLFNTIVTDRAARLLTDLDICKIMWVHESDDSLYDAFPLEARDRRLHYYAVGQKAAAAFRLRYPDKAIGLLPYYFPDIQSCLKREPPKLPVVFGMIGGGALKGEDILDWAVRDHLAPYYDRMILSFVFSESGDRHHWKRYGSAGLAIRISEEITQQEILDFYRHIDALLCPSRCDTMPLVVTQAMQNGVPCIISDQVGQNELSPENWRFTFESENAAALASCIASCVDCRDKLPNMGRTARTVYETYFSAEVFERNWIRVLQELEMEETP